uniref:Uncharacterized protein n=1 Tax=Anguilla anguilla TaxID=7936 RepID=A0A0E9XTR2_ANGAN
MLHLPPCAGAIVTAYGGNCNNTHNAFI